MTDKMLTVEEIEELGNVLFNTPGVRASKALALRDMALAHRRAVEGEKPVAWRERIEQFDACIRAVAAELGACCGGVDGDQSDPHSTTAVLLAKIRELHSALIEAGAADGEVVAGTGSMNDLAVIRWISCYRPKIGDKIYAVRTPGEGECLRCGATKGERTDCLVYGRTYPTHIYRKASK